MRFIYSYTGTNRTNEVADFLATLMKTHAPRAAHYDLAFRMVGQTGNAPWDKYHRLDPRGKIPKGVAKDAASGRPLSLDGMVVFKNIGHKSRIYGCTEPEGLIILMTVYQGKKEDDLTADAINPALYARVEYLGRKEVLLRKRTGSTR